MRLFWCPAVFWLSRKTGTSVSSTPSATGKAIDSSQTGMPFSVVRGFDEDGDTVSFELVSGALGMFALNATSGELSPTGPLDFEQQAEYTLGIELKLLLLVFTMCIRNSLAR